MKVAIVNGSLRGYEARRQEEPRVAVTRLFAIVNCAHAEPEITSEALRVLRNFGHRMGFRWGGAVAIGCGPMVKAVLRIPILGRAARSALASIAKRILRPADLEETVLFVRPPLPKALIFWIRDTFFLKQ
jgi:hypothetical protein